jgi:hypothetical protein
MKRLLNQPPISKKTLKSLTRRLERLKDAGVFEELIADPANHRNLQSFFDAYINLSNKVNYSLKDIKDKGKKRSFLAYAHAAEALLKNPGEKQGMEKATPSLPSSSSLERLVPPGSPRSLSAGSDSSNSDSSLGASGTRRRGSMDLSGYSSADDEGELSFTKSAFGGTIVFMPPPRSPVGKAPNRSETQILETVPEEVLVSSSGSSSSSSSSSSIGSPGYNNRG